MNAIHCVVISHCVYPFIFIQVSVDLGSFYLLAIVSDAAVNMSVQYIYFFFSKTKTGTSLVVQWLRLQTPNAGGPDSIPGQGTKDLTPQLKILCVATKTQCRQINSSYKMTSFWYHRPSGMLRSGWELVRKCRAGSTAH